MYPDDAARKTNWSWDYTGVTLNEATALQDFFQACDGPLRPFTFMDPTGNLLSNSSDFRASEWHVPTPATISGASLSPLPGAAAWMVTNDGQSVQELTQLLSIRCNYDYCFSLYVRSATPQSVTLFRRSSVSEQITLFETGPEWKRLWRSGNLQDQSTGLSVGVKLSPGQQLSMSAAQLEAQPGVSPYRRGQQTGDLYVNAHWAFDELNVRYLGPNSCAVSVSIEAFL